MLITFFLIVLLTRVSSLDWNCVWEAESKMAVGKIMFRDIFLTPFGYNLDTEPITDLCGGKKPPDISFWKYWGDAFLKRVSSLDWDCVWEAESKMAVGKIMFRDIFLTPFGYDLDTEPLTNLCRGKKPPDISFWKYWGDAFLKSLPSCDWLCIPETNRMIGEELFRAIFLTPFRLEWDPQEGNKPTDEISFWHYWDYPVFIVLDFLFAIGLAILVYTCVLSFTSLVAKEKPKKDGTSTQAKQTADKETQTVGDSGLSIEEWALVEVCNCQWKRKK